MRAEGMLEPASKKAAKRKRHPRHVPQRTCVGCRQVAPKREMVRIVRTVDGLVEVDPTGKKAGRGAYLCRKSLCWELGLGKNRLDHALEIKIDPETKAQLLEYAKTLVPEPA